MKYHNNCFCYFLYWFTDTQSTREYLESSNLYFPHFKSYFYTAWHITLYLKDCFTYFDCIKASGSLGTMQFFFAITIFIFVPFTASRNTCILLMYLHPTCKYYNHYYLIYRVISVHDPESVKSVFCLFVLFACVMYTDLTTWIFIWNSEQWQRHINLKVHNTREKFATCPPGENLQQSNLALLFSGALGGHIITLIERNRSTLKSNCTLTLQLGVHLCDTVNLVLSFISLAT